MMASIFLILAVVGFVLTSSHEDVDEPDAGGPGQRHTADSLLVVNYSIQGGLLFATDQDELRPGQAEQAQARAAILGILHDACREIPRLRRQFVRSSGCADYFVVVEAAGHADSTKSPQDTLGAYNWKLSSRRGASVVQFIEALLAQPQNAPLKRQLLRGDTLLRAAGYSSQLPVATPATHAHNRRVEIRLYIQPAYMLVNPP
jgi:hypothetical protein